MAKSKKAKVIMKATLIIGVIIIPLLYSFFYLGAFWDPYANLDQVPVAVVNLDKGAKINGETRNLGDEICDNLKEDGSVKFTFTDKKDADSGVLGDEYYAQILIPEDFSSNAATASEDTKKIKGEIKYISNQKKNYLAAQILENAMPKIKEEVNSNIDKEIINTLSDKLNSVPDQMGELQDGLNQLNDGSKELRDNLKTLDDGAVQLKDGANDLAVGAKALDNGATTLKDGMQDLYDGVGSLGAQLPTLINGVKQLDDGAGQLQAGAKTLTDGTAQLDDGAGQLQDGANLLGQKLPALATGIGSLDDGATKLNSGLGKLSSNNAKLNGGATALKAGATQLQAGLGEYTTGVSALKDGATKLNAAINQASAGVDQITTQVKGSIDKLNTEASDDTLNQLKGGASSVSKGVDNFKNGYDAAMAQVAIYNDTTKDEATRMTALQTALAYFNQLNQSLPTLKTGAAQVSAGVDSVTGGMKDVKTNTATLYAGMQQLQAGFGNVATNDTILNGSAQVVGGLTALDGKNSALNTGAKDLADGSSDLQSGLGDYTTGVSGAYVGATQLQAGAKELNDNVPALTDGAGQLITGINSLKDGSTQVNDGAILLCSKLGDLKAGTAQLNGAVPTLTDGAGQLTDGTAQLLAGVVSLKAATPQIADGASLLNTKLGDVKSGTSQLYDGSKQIKDGIQEAKDGVDDSITDTNKQLKSLDGLAEYGSEPVSYSTEYVEPVDNYGSAFAPYFMGLSLWVGALMIFFGVYLDYNKKIKMLTKDSKNPYKRDLAFAGISAVQGLMLGVVIQGVLKIAVANVFMLYASCVLVSLVFMSIVQFCMMNLGNVGKFLSLLFLILQLTSCAGTFPIETQSNFYRVINPLLPMTYSTQLFKEAMAGTFNSNAVKSLLVLIGYFVVFMVLSIIGIAINSAKSKKQEAQTVAA